MNEIFVRDSEASSMSKTNDSFFDTTAEQDVTQAEFNEHESGLKLDLLINMVIITCVLQKLKRDLMKITIKKLSVVWKVCFREA